jgi:hypothetical protein
MKLLRTTRARAAAVPRGPAPGLAIVPLPYPEAGAAGRRPTDPHGHRCAACGAAYECAGPDDMGLCAPVCAACYSVELGSQLRIYLTVVAELKRKRRAMEKIAGSAACRQAERFRRRTAARGRLLTGFGQVIALGDYTTGRGDNGCSAPEAAQGFQSPD